MNGEMEYNHLRMNIRVYAAFIEPKTQKEAVEIVYDKSYQDINMRPFREARKRLTNKGLLENVDGSMRNATFKSQGNFSDRSKYDKKYLSNTKFFRVDESGSLVLDNRFLFQNLMRSLEDQ